MKDRVPLGIEQIYIGIGSKKAGIRYAFTGIERKENNDGNC
jgi:hypothetical protein